ncbi:unnamed protein product [Coregonus sp. 'balchen']|nr:unnamed protein product [Coregonus sp. 'balchen']
MDPLIGKLTQIVFGHWDVVTCLARSESYIGGDCYIVSGSRDATLLLWYWSGRHHIIGDNPNNRDLLRALEGPELCLRPRLISVSSEGHCIICYERGRFCNFSINGKLLAQMEVNDSTRACDFKQLYIYPGCDAGIRAMDLSHDQRWVGHQSFGVSVLIQTGIVMLVCSGLMWSLPYVYLCGHLKLSW